MLGTQHSPMPSLSKIALAAACLLLAGVAESQDGTGAQTQRPSHLGAWLGTIHGLERPVGVALGPGNRVHVVEAGAHRVRVFSAEGQELRSLGGRGDGPGQLLEPQGVAVAPDGTIFVADTGNHRISVFSADGEPLRQWGGLGSAAGRFHTPRGLALSGERLAVADEGNERVQVFDLSGRHLSSVATRGNEGPARPTDVALTPAGELLVVDADRQRIERYDSEGRRVATLGGHGFFPGLYANPLGVSLAQGRVFVADQENHRVQVFELESLIDSAAAVRPVYVLGLHAIRPREGRGKLHYPTDVAVAPDLSLAAICEPLDDRVQLFGRAEGREPVPDPLRVGIGQASAHLGAQVALDETWMTTVEPETHQVILHDVRKGSPIMVSRFGGFGFRMGQFVRPTGMALDMESRSLLVCDTGNRRLQELTIDLDPAADLRQDFEIARYVRTLDFERLGLELGELTLEWTIVPVALAVEWERGPEGRIFLLDARNERVHVLDRALRFLSSFGGHGTEPGQLRRPTDLVLDPSGTRVWVVDASNARLQAFSPEGKLLSVVGQGTLSSPRGLVCAADGSVLVSDDNHHALFRFDAEGELISRFGEQGIQRGRFHDPLGLALDGAGRVTVMDHGNHRGLILELDGEFVDAFGSRLYTAPAKRPDKFRPEDYVE